MPALSGVTIGWDENDPANTSDVSGGNEAMHSIKTSLRTALDAEHNWPSASGSGFGYHVYGSARPFYGLQSAVSSSGSDGRLMLASDTSRLFGSGSGGTTFFGGPTVPLMGSHPGDVPQRHMWAEEVGTVAASDITNAAAGYVVTFPNSGFSGLPYTFLTLTGPESSGELKTISIVTALGTFSGTQMVIQVYNPNGGIFDQAKVMWRSIGTRAT